ncbi:hypothetical protein M2109_002149 [Paenibacillus sp. PastH-3]|nr:hypothetical protein [Paenibacillus sp. PastF-4]MDH6527832.1 hypothetical protein [Paenibacillus sp. PastH-3]
MITTFFGGITEVFINLYNISYHPYPHKKNPQRLERQGFKGSSKASCIDFFPTHELVYDRYPIRFLSARRSEPAHVRRELR